MYCNAGGFEEKTLFPLAACIVKNKLLFSTLYNNLLIEIDLISGNILERELPVDMCTEFAYRFSIKYLDYVIFIPMYENIFSFFNTKSESFSTIKSIGHYRDFIMMGDQLLLLDIERPFIDVLNLDNQTYSDSIPLPSLLNGQYYDSFFILNGDIYVLVYNSSKILKITSGKSGHRWIEANAIISYGVLYQNGLFFSDSTKDEKSVYRFDFNTFMTEKMASIQYNSLCPVQWTRFWSPKRIGKMIYFLPHESNEIIRYDIESNNISYIVPFSKEHKSLRPNEYSAVYDILSFQENLIVIPYYGNTISVINPQGEIIRSYSIPLTDKQIAYGFYEIIQKNSIVYEDLIDLHDFIDCLHYEVLPPKGSCEVNYESIGEKIYRNLEL